MIYRLPDINSLIELHNQVRKNAWFIARKSLEPDDKLFNYADRWVQEMSRTNQLKHSNIKNILALGYKAAAENISHGQRDEYGAMESWLNSYQHRKNILNKQYTHIGCSFSYAKDDSLYWCVCFGKK